LLPTTGESKADVHHGNMVCRFSVMHYLKTSEAVLL
jgi:hypothetical protein